MYMRTIKKSKTAPEITHAATITGPVKAFLKELATQTRNAEKLHTKATPEVLAFMKEMGLEFSSDDAIIAAEELDKIIATSRRNY